MLDVMTTVLQLRSERLAKGWSLKELARRCEERPSASDLSLIERGKREVFPSWRRRIAAALRLPQKRLFGPMAEATPVQPADPTALVNDRVLETATR